MTRRWRCSSNLVAVYGRLWASGSPPDLDAFLASTGPVDTVQLSALARIDQAERWQRGDRRSAEEYLERYSALQADHDSAVDLIYHEYLLREKFSFEPSVEEFTRRFPQHATAIAEQIRLYRALRDVTEDVSDSFPTSDEMGPIPQLASPLLPKLPAQFGRYRVLELLGRGGMGSVYLAEDTELGRQVALKLPRFDRDVSPEVLDRFRREARIAATFHHPNLCPVYDFGELDGTLFLTMPRMTGQPLSTRLEGGPLPEAEAVEIALKIARAMSVAHRAGVVHRDLKPSNILLREDGEPVVMDFGLARRGLDLDPKLTGSGALVGTIAYMSPEQVAATNHEIGPLSDVYSLGVILYEMLTGRPPFEGSWQELLQQIQSQLPPAPSQHVRGLSPGLDQMCMQALAKDPQDRFGSMDALAGALAQLVEHDGTVIASQPKGWRPPRVRQRPSAHRRRRRLIAAVVAGALLVGVSGTSILLLNRNGNRTEAIKPAEATRAIEALAVLPFENVGGDPDTEYLSDGLADHLINSLSQVRRGDLKIRPFTSVSRYKGQKPDVPTVASDLNVQLVVTGAVHQQGDGLSIGVAVVDAREDNQLFGHRYPGKLSGILDLQDQIARDVATNLRLRLTGEEEQRLTKRYTEDPEAYLLFREGMHHLNMLRPDRVQRAKGCFERALERDSNFAPALMGLGRYYQLTGLFQLGTRQTYPQAKKYLLEALAIDDTLADAHAGLALVYMTHDWDWPAAERESKIAFDLGSELPMYGFYLASNGRLPEALTALERGHELDPLTPARRNELAMCYNWLRQHDEAITWAQKAIDLDENFILPYGELGLAYSRKGMHTEAITELKKGLDVSKGHPRMRGMLGYAYAAAGERGKAHEVLEALTSPPERRFGDAFAIAQIYTALGEIDQAFAWLHKACDERDHGVVRLKVDLTFDNLRSDPRFAELLKQMGLPP